MADKKNIFYALYTEHDEYIAGFKTFREIGEYLGLKRCSVSSLCCVMPDKKEEIIRNLVQDEESDQIVYFQCSQCIHRYGGQRLKNRYGENLGARCKLYKFWEEKAEKGGGNTNE